jgi:hypothetical protein
LGDRLRNADAENLFLLMKQGIAPSRRKIIKCIWTDSVKASVARKGQAVYEDVYLNTEDAYFNTEDVYLSTEDKSSLTKRYVFNIVSYAMKDGKRLP